MGVLIRLNLNMVRTVKQVNGMIVGPRRGKPKGKEKTSLYVCSNPANVGSIFEERDK